MVTDKQYLNFMAKVGYISQKHKIPGDIVTKVLNTEIEFINRFEIKTEKGHDEIAKDACELMEELNRNRKRAKHPIPIV